MSKLKTKEHFANLAKRSHQVRIKKTLDKIAIACQQLEKEGEAINVIAVADRTGLDRSTLYRYYAHLF